MKPWQGDEFDGVIRHDEEMREDIPIVSGDASMPPAKRYYLGSTKQEHNRLQKIIKQNHE